MTEKKLVKKLAEVMKQVKYIEKRGFNKFHKYSYATESDVSDAVRDLLAEQNVIMLPDVIKHEVREHTNRHNNIEYISTVKVKFTFIDGETGESLSIHSVGEGQDAGDKGVYKAITGATKYALMKVFMIPTGDDPESDNGVDERNNGNNAQPPKNDNLLRDIKIKWQALAGSLDGFDDFHKKRTSEGFSDQQILDFLTKRLLDKSKEDNVKEGA